MLLQERGVGIFWDLFYSKPMDLESFKEVKQPFTDTMNPACQHECMRGMDFVTWVAKEIQENQAEASPEQIEAVGKFMGHCMLGPFERNAEACSLKPSQLCNHTELPDFWDMDALKAKAHELLNGEQ